MATVAHYARPASVEEALRLLERPAAVPLGGGTQINARPSSAAIEVVDLQSVGLDRIERLGEGRLRIGATVTLQELADSTEAPAVVREAARRERPSTLRTQATVGGTLAAADWESELLAALIAHEAVVEVVAGGGSRELALERLLAELPLAHGSIIGSATISTDGRSCAERAGRTRADRPIVAVVARLGEGLEPRVAAAGVARTPILLDPGRELTPPSDFRGSGDYRRALAETLARRAQEGLT